VHVEPKLAVEAAVFADGAIDEHGSSRLVLGEQIHLVRLRELGRRVGILAENRLAPDYDDFIIISDIAGRSDGMLQLLTSHGRELDHERLQGLVVRKDRVALFAREHTDKR
jgi:hypothetical protein